MKLTDFASLAHLLHEHKLIIDEKFSKLTAATGFDCTKEESTVLLY